MTYEFGDILPSPSCRCLEVSVTGGETCRLMGLTLGVAEIGRVVDGAIAAYDLGLGFRAAGEAMCSIAAGGPATAVVMSSDGCFTELLYVVAE